MKEKRWERENMAKKNETITRNFYYYDLALFNMVGSDIKPVNNQQEKFIEIFKYVKNQIGKIEKSTDKSEKKKILKNISAETEDGDLIYVIVDNITKEAIKFRIVLCRNNALPFVENNGELSSLTEYLPNGFSLAEITHCVIFPEDDIMGAEYNYAGARPSVISDYVSYALKKVDFALCRPKMKFDTFKQIIDGKPLGYFELSVKNTKEMKNALRRKKGLLAGITYNVPDVDQYEICLVRRITKTKGGFNPLLTRDEMQDFILNNRDDIKRFRIGYGAKKDAIDLLNDKMVCKKKMIKTDKRTINSEDAYSTIVQFYGSNVKVYD